MTIRQVKEVHVGVTHPPSSPRDLRGFLHFVGAPNANGANGYRLCSFCKKWGRWGAWFSLLVATSARTLRFSPARRESASAELRAFWIIFFIAMAVFWRRTAINWHNSAVVMSWLEIT